MYTCRRCILISLSESRRHLNSGFPLDECSTLGNSLQVIIQHYQKPRMQNNLKSLDNVCDLSRLLADTPHFRSSCFLAQLPLHQEWERIVQASQLWTAFTWQNKCHFNRSNKHCFQSGRQHRVKKAS